jgi:hypothetical protein
MFVLNYSLTREREGENEPTQDKKKKKTEEENYGTTNDEEF